MSTIDAIASIVDILKMNLLPVENILMVTDR